MRSTFLTFMTLRPKAKAHGNTMGDHPHIFSVFKLKVETLKAERLSAER